MTMAKKESDFNKSPFNGERINESSLQNKDTGKGDKIASEALGTRTANKGVVFGDEWDDFLKGKYGVDNVVWETETIYEINRLENVDNFRSGALEHILEGELNARGRAVGFHYEGMPTQKGSIVIGTESLPNSKGVYTAMVEVDDVVKSANSSFFPKDWNLQQIVNGINEAYVNRQFISGNRYSGVLSNGLEIQMYLDSSGNIISAFPIY
ncbi:hypothetical protein AM592_14300 [Bacillus gobiensis]|uniref:Bacterial EndoU nuclease domain-containing protein n=3 Tax=Bacillaceae TaxID=186817 RepID=A0A0M4FL20_9BACI|nr:hypothetical protein AM592_14300 [Bacillus gobiensis]MBP1081551.1 hypothetical protein [Bacillus capparidis]